MFKYYIKSEHPINRVDSTHCLCIIRIVIPATYTFCYNVIKLHLNIITLFVEFQIFNLKDAL